MATLKQLVDETTNIKNELISCHSDLKNNLINEGVEILDSDKMSDLIDKLVKNSIGASNFYKIYGSPFKMNDLLNSYNPFFTIKDDNLIIFGGSDTSTGVYGTKKAVLNLNSFEGVVEEFQTSGSRAAYALPLIRLDEHNEPFTYYTQSNNSAFATKLDKRTLTLTSTSKFTTSSYNGKYYITMHKDGIVANLYRSNANSAIFTYDELTNTWTQQFYTNGGLGNFKNVMNVELESSFLTFCSSINSYKGGLVNVDFNLKTYTLLWSIDNIKDFNLNLMYYDYVLQIDDTRYLFVNANSTYADLVNISKNTIDKIPIPLGYLIVEYKSDFYIYGGFYGANNPSILKIK